MGRLKRMTEEEYQQLKKEYEEVDQQYKALQKQRAKIKRKLYWYEYNSNLSKSYKEGLSYQLFGKRKKDLTPEELREYNRIGAEKSRKKKKSEESAQLDKDE